MSSSTQNISNARAPAAVLDMHSCTKAVPESCPPITESSSSGATLYFSPNKEYKKATGASIDEDSSVAGLNSSDKIVRNEASDIICLCVSVCLFFYNCFF